MRETGQLEAVEDLLAGRARRIESLLRAPDPETPRALQALYDEGVRMDELLRALRDGLREELSRTERDLRLTREMLTGLPGRLPRVHLEA